MLAIQLVDPALDEFLNPRINPYSLDVFWARQSILNDIRRALPEFFGTVLDVGCGRMPYRSLLLSAPSRATAYLGLDLEANHYRNQPDLTWDGNNIPLTENSVECALATEVLEHCPDPLKVLSEINRVLKPEGFLFLTVPFLWPLHDVPYDEFRYTPFSMERLLQQAGFARIQVNAIGGWDASLAQMMGLWIRRRPMNETARRVLQRLAMPLYRYLLSNNQVPDCSQSVMITGLSARAWKSAS
jgi:SAM-dependent methyltransferase